MLSPVSLALIYSISAGAMNGSFALPTKHIKNWTFENIWLNYAIWGFLILPWTTIFLLDSHIGNFYLNVPGHIWFILLIGGFLFGAGQVCFALALRGIGLGLGFVINIGLGTLLGSLLPLLTMDSQNLLTPAGATTLCGIGLIMVGLFLSYLAGKQRNTATGAESIYQNKKMYHLSVLLAVFAGLFSAGQNYVFALTGNLSQIALANGADSLAASIIIWPPFLTASLIPYALYMLYLHQMNRSFQHYQRDGLIKNNVFGILMGALWFGSLAIYSKASLLIGALGPIIAWPLFMVLIILTSNFWSWRHKEWDNCAWAIQKKVIFSVVALVSAVLLLTASISLTH